MRTRVQRWGNSPAVRIPRHVAEDAEFSERTAVELTVAHGAVVVTATEEAPTLAELVAGITDTNVHGPTDFGEPRGQEVW